MLKVVGLRSIYRIAFILVVSLLTLSMIEEAVVSYQIDVIDSRYQVVGTLQFDSDTDESLTLNTQDSHQFYLSVKACYLGDRCRLVNLERDLKSKDFKVKTVDQDNKFFSSKEINYKLILKGKAQKESVNLSFGIAHDLILSDHVLLTDDKAEAKVNMVLNARYSKRYLEHIEASEYLRNFHLQEYGEDGGFLGLTGMTTEAILREKSVDEIENVLGLIVDGKEILGVHDLKWSAESKEKVVSFSCAMCHFGRAAGMIIPGLGNKNATPSGLAKVGLSYEETLKYKAHNAWMKLFLSKEEKTLMKEMNDESREILIALQSELTNNLTQGLTAVNQTPLRFYRDLNVEVPENYPRAPSKAQAMWGLGEKRAEGGQFSDGGADGDSPMWAAGYDMGSLMKTEYMMEAKEKLKKVQEAYGKILPPAYPFKIDKEKARRGERHYQKSCAKCHSAHGPYERDDFGHPIYKSPRLIPYKYVETEPERMHLFDGLDELVQKHPLKKVLKVTPKEKRPYLGYYAPRLVSIWARYPYLHNGSVPNLMALLTHPDERPKVFSLRDAGKFERFDQKKMGLTMPESAEEIEELKRRAARGEQGVYDISRDEHSNQGHTKGLDLSTEEKYELIEYLKTL